VSEYEFLRIPSLSMDITLFDQSLAKLLLRREPMSCKYGWIPDNHALGVISGMTFIYSLFRFSQCPSMSRPVLSTGN